MPKKLVYQFTVFDISQSRNVLAKRMATLEAIKNFKGAPIMDTAQEVDARKRCHGKGVRP